MVLVGHLISQTEHPMHLSVMKWGMAAVSVTYRSSVKVLGHFGRPDRRSITTPATAFLEIDVEPQLASEFQRPLVKAPPLQMLQSFHDSFRDPLPCHFLRGFEQSGGQ